MNILSYNFYSRPRILFKDNQIERAKFIGQMINDYETMNYCKIDVIFLQEIFDNKTNKIIKQKLKSLGFIHKTHRDKKWFRINGGGLIYSRCPIIEQGNMCFDKGQIFNIAAAKGMNYAKIVKQGKVYNCYNIHLDSFDSKIRTKQMEQMKEYIEDRYSPLSSDIIGGDWNIDLLSDEGEDIDLILDTYTLPGLDEYGDTISKENDWVKRRITKDNDPDKKAEMLDYFIHSGNKIAVSYMKVIKFQYNQLAYDILYSPPFFLNIYKWNKDLKVSDMSDHYAVLLQLH